MSNNKNSAFWGSVALSGIADTQAAADAHYQSWMTANLDDAPYYQGTLRMLYLLVAAGALPSTL